MFKDIFEEFKRIIESSIDYPAGSVTEAWVAGLFKKIMDFPLIDKFINDDKVLPEYKDFWKILFLFRKFTLKNQLVTKLNNNYYKVTPLGNNFLKYLNGDIEIEKKMDAHRTPFGRSPEYKKLWYDFVNALGEADKEWVDSLSEFEKNYLEVYSTFTPKQFALLKGLYAKTGRDLTNMIYSVMKNNSDDYNFLVKNKFLKSDASFNRTLTERFFSFLGKAGYSKLKNFNKELSYTSDRASADKALALNYAERQFANSPRANEAGKEIREYLLSLTDQERNELKQLFEKNKFKKESKERLKKQNIIDADNNLTSFGKLVKFTLTHKDINDYVDQFKDYKYFPNREQNTAEKLERTNKKAKGRSKSFKDFLTK